MRGESCDFAVKLQVFGIEFKPTGIAPAAQPLQQLQAGEKQNVAVGGTVGIRFGEPANKFPIFGRKEFLLVRRTGGQLAELGERANLFASARTKQAEAHRQMME